MSVSNEIIFPSGVFFLPVGAELTSTARGTYKKKRNGIMFFDRAGEPLMFLKKDGSVCFLISASRREDNKIWYSYLSSKTEDEIGLKLIRHSEQSDFCYKIWEKFFV